MNKRYSDFLRLIHNCLWLYTLACFIGECLVHQDTESVLVCMLPLLPVILYSFFAYAQAKRLWSYLLLELPAFIAAAALGNFFGQTGPYVITVLVMLGCQLIERRSPFLAPLRPCPHMAVFFAAIYFLSVFYNCLYVELLALFGLMAEVLLLVFYENREGLCDFLEVRQNIRSMPYRQIYMSNRLMLSGIVLVLLFIFICAGFFLDNSPLEALGGMLMAFIRSLIRRMLDVETGPPAAGGDLFQELPEDFTGDAEEFAQESLLNARVSKGWDIAAWCILAAAGILLFIALVRGIWKLLTAFFERQTRRENKEELVQDEITDLSEERRKKPAAAYARGEKVHIRRIYKKEIRRKRRENRRRGPVDPAFTPTQIEEDSVYGGQMKEGEYQHWQELHALYEEARYGGKQ